MVFVGEKYFAVIWREALEGEGVLRRKTREGCSLAKKNGTNLIGRRATDFAHGRHCQFKYESYYQNSCEVLIDWVYRKSGDRYPSHWHADLPIFYGDFGFEIHSMRNPLVTLQKVGRSFVLWLPKSSPALNGNQWFARCLVFSFSP